MTYKQNLHVHTSYCDGRDTPEEVVLAAMEQGFSSIGFSGHSYMHYSPGHSMSLAGTEEYRREVARLRKKYAGQIKLFCGLEVDMYSEIDLSGYDYLIGSVHYLPIDGEYVGFDRSQDEVQRVIDVYFHGDGMAYARMYYEQLVLLPNFGKFDILGHFDLITKHSENAAFFDEESPVYRSYAIEAAEALAKHISLFEVNTGAISRGYRTSPYPSVFLLKEMKRLGYGAVITSDCHDARALSCHYEESAELLRSCGFRELYILDEPGVFRTVSL
ncbi:MAG: histidinol-phosphatase [Clostridia bacterium]|nr:histidinol-phosphatase [Clostridia bacterium]